MPANGSTVKLGTYWPDTNMTPPPDYIIEGPEPELTEPSEIIDGQLELPSDEAQLEFELE